jgi:hypothetical protein
MQQFSIFLLHLLMFFGAVAEAQITQIWDKQPAGTEGFVAADAVLLRKSDNQKMAVAGETTRGKAHFAVLYVVDCQDGTLTDSLVLPNGGFKALVESENGDLYVGGYYNGSKKDPTGRIVRYRPDERVKDLDTVLAGTAAIERMVWLYHNGLAFARLPQHKGSMQVILLERQGVKVQVQHITVGNGAIKDMVAALPVSWVAKEAWLAGNSQQSAAGKAGQTWLLRVDELGGFNNAPLLAGAGNYEEVTTAALDSRGQIILAGAAQKDSQEDDLWLAKPVIGQNNRLLNDAIFSPDTIGEDRITAISTSVCHDFMAMLQKKEGRSVRNTLHTSKGTNIENRILFKLSGTQLFRPVAFLQEPIAENIYYLAGTSAHIDGSHGHLRILALQETCARGKKEQPEQPSSQPVNSEGKGGASVGKGTAAPLLRVEDLEVRTEKNGDASDVVVRFTLVNDGSDMPASGEVEVTAAQLVNGLSIVPGDMIRKFPALKSGQKSWVINIKMKAAERVAYGTSHFTLAVKMQGQTLLTFKSPLIETGQNDQGGGYSLAWLPGTGGNRTGEERTTRTVILRTKDPGVQSSDLSAGGPGFARQNKANPKLIDRQFSDGMYTYIFEIDISLDTGNNEIFVQLSPEKGGASTEKLVIERSTYHPNLYIIAIGVPYDNLFYTDDDANDFINAAQKMANGTLFGEVKMARLLNTPANTTREAIQDAFNALTGKKIRPEDYVMVLISSHGDIFKGNSQDRFFILPSDYAPKQVSKSIAADGKTTGAEGEQVTRPFYYYNMIEVLKDVNCRRFVFIDACHSGLGKGGDRSKLLEEANAAAPGLVCFLSSQSQQLSYEYENGKNGVFTEALLEAMAGKTVTLFGNGQPLVPDTDGNGTVSIRELRAFLSVRVPDLLLDTKHKNQSQEPVYMTSETEGLPDNQPVFTIQKN